MSCPCGLTQERVLEVAEKHRVPLVGGLCQNPFITPDGTLGICGKPLGAHPSAPSAVPAPEASSQVSAFIPSTTTFKLAVETIPDSLLHGEEDESNHASTMFNSDTAVVKQWFRNNLVMPRDWELEHPNDIPAGASNKFDYHVYRSAFANAGFKLWDIQNKIHATSYIELTTVNEPSQSALIGGRADYLVTRIDANKANYLSKILCIIEVQSKEKEDLCELQMQVYLLILMNTKHLRALVGFAVFRNGQCRAFKATRDEGGGCVFEMNDRFHVTYIAQIFEEISTELFNKNE